MKGVVFTEFMDHVETAHGPLVVDKIIETSNTQSQGAYTSVGTYPCAELVSLIVSLSQHSGIDVPEIITQFGERKLFNINFQQGEVGGRIYTNYGSFELSLIAKGDL